MPERKLTEQALHASSTLLAEELQALMRLREFGQRLMHCILSKDALLELLDAALELLGAPMGDVRLCDAHAQALELVAQRDVPASVLEHYRSTAPDSGSACARTLERGARVIVEDTHSDAHTGAPSRWMDAAGVRAVQCTPLTSADGELIGVLSTYFREPHAPSERELRLLDLYVRQAIDVLERLEAEAQLRDSEARHRFLAELNEALAPLADAPRIMATATQMLGEHLGVDRCCYGETETDEDHFRIAGEYTRNVPHIAGRWSLSSFGGEALSRLRAGETTVVHDLHAAPRAPAELDAYGKAQIRALVAVPLLRDGRLAAGMAVHQAHPRRWSHAEVDLVRLVVQRCWVSIERSRAQQLLADSERQFRLLADALPQIVHVHDAQGHIEYLNRQWHDYAGASSAEAAERALTPAWAAARECGGAVERQTRLRSGDGHERWFLTRIVPLSGDGRIVRWYGTSTDIDAIKRVEDALRASEQRFRRLAESMPHLVFTMRHGGGVTWANPYTDRFTGAPGGALGERRFELMHHDDTPRVKAAWKAAFERGDVYETESRLRRADGTWCWVLTRALPVRDDNGEIVEWVGASIDIHQLRTAQQSLEETDRRKDEFLATLAHELRNPLAPLRNAMHILRLAGGAAAFERVQAMMERQIDHMVHLVDDLLEASRITRGKIELRKETIDLSAVLTSAVETSRPLIESAHHELAVALPAEPLLLEGDAMRLAQVFSNLLNNAAKYTESGGHIRLEARRDGDDALVAVRDDGIGLPADKLDDVFEMFTQVDRSAGRAQGGLGIGLALVKSLVAMHGGQVRAVSQGPGRGSEFIVRLPVAPALPASASVSPRAQPSEAMRQQRVLVVDDNRDAADSLAMLLEYLGANAHVVNDGAAALAAIDTYHPAVVLLDLGMPGMDGFEVARRIRLRAHEQTPKLIALTGWGQEEDRRRTRDAGFDHHLTKPADVDALQALLAAPPSTPLSPVGRELG